MKKILIIGGSGFLGSHVADAFSHKGYQVTIFDKVKYKFLKKNQKLILGDTKNIKKLEAVIKNKDVVYNYAGIADIEATKYIATQTVKENILPTVQILELCQKYKIKKFIFASTVYVHSNQGFFYRCSKQAAELYIKEFSKIHSLKYSILRYGSLYGPRAGENNGIYKIVKNILSKNKLIYVGKKNAEREYVHVFDAAKATVELLDKKFDNQSIIITGSNKYTIQKIIEILSEILGKKINLVFANKSKNSGGHYNVSPYSYQEDVSKKYTLPFHIDIDQGLLDIIKQIKK